MGKQAKVKRERKRNAVDVQRLIEGAPNGDVAYQARQAMGETHREFSSTLNSGLRQLTHEITRHDAQWLAWLRDGMKDVDQLQALERVAGEIEETIRTFLDAIAAYHEVWMRYHEAIVATRKSGEASSATEAV